MQEFRPIHTLLLTLSVVAILLLVSLYTPADNSSLRSIDLFGQIRPTSESSEVAPADLFVDQLDESIDNSIEQSVHIEQHNPTKRTIDIDEKPTNQATDTVKKSHSKKEWAQAQTINTPNNRPNLEDLSTPTKIEVALATESNSPSDIGSDRLESTIENSAALSSFFDKLSHVNSLNRPVRIAVLGDSFIEGDILTQDLREMFQDRFGGCGVGFMPMAMAISSYRRTVKHNYSGWTTHCISTASMRKNYTISSYTFTPSDGSTSRFEVKNSKRHLDSFLRARLLLVNSKESKIEVRVNDKRTQQFTPAQSPTMQQIIVADDSIGSIDFTFYQSDAMTVYGVYLDGVSGVAVDNYSVRGNSGISLSSTSATLLSQFNTLQPVDLIILQYGLNVVQADVRNYDQYTKQMQASIEHLSSCFPSASILVLSVPDRSHLTAGGWKTMPGITAMERAQRKMAARCNVAFWSIMNSMQQIGGMGTFVSNGWAAKDYIHLSHKGGKVIATKLFNAMMESYEK